MLNDRLLPFINVDLQDVKVLSFTISLSGDRPAFLVPHVLFP